MESDNINLLLIFIIEILFVKLWAIGARRTNTSALDRLISSYLGRKIGRRLTIKRGILWSDDVAENLHVRLNFYLNPQVYYTICRDHYCDLWDDQAIGAFRHFHSCCWRKVKPSKTNHIMLFALRKGWNRDSFYYVAWKLCMFFRHNLILNTYQVVAYVIKSWEWTIK